MVCSLVGSIPLPSVSDENLTAAFTFPASKKFFNFQLLAQWMWISFAKLVWADYK